MNKPDIIQIVLFGSEHNLNEFMQEVKTRGFEAFALVLEVLEGLDSITRDNMEKIFGVQKDITAIEAKLCKTFAKRQWTQEDINFVLSSCLDETAFGDVFWPMIEENSRLKKFVNDFNQEAEKTIVSGIAPPPLDVKEWLDAQKEEEEAP